MSANPSNKNEMNLAGFVFLVLLLFAVISQVDRCRDESNADKESVDYYASLGLEEMQDTCTAFHRRLRFTRLDPAALDMAHGDYKIEGDYEWLIALQGASWILYCSDHDWPRRANWFSIDRKVRKWFYGSVDEQLARVGKWMDKHYKP